jgi:hypothetical protein
MMKNRKQIWEPKKYGKMFHENLKFSLLKLDLFEI